MAVAQQPRLQKIANLLPRKVLRSIIFERCFLSLTQLPPSGRAESKREIRRMSAVQASAVHSRYMFPRLSRPRAF